MTTARHQAPADENYWGTALRRANHASVRYRVGTAARRSVGARANDEVRARL
jgi:hypothetical protein